MELQIKLDEILEYREASHSLSATSMPLWKNDRLISLTLLSYHWKKISNRV